MRLMSAFAVLLLLGACHAERKPDARGRRVDVRTPPLIPHGLEGNAAGIGMGDRLRARAALRHDR